MTDPWYLRLSTAMRSALAELGRHGKLRRIRSGYTAHAMAVRFQEHTILALCDRGLTQIRRPGRHLSSHYVILTDTGRMFAEAVAGAKGYEAQK